METRRTKKIRIKVRGELTPQEIQKAKMEDLSRRFKDLMAEFNKEGYTLQPLQRLEIRIVPLIMPGGKTPLPT